MIDFEIPGVRTARIVALLAILACVGAAIAYHLVRVSNLRAEIATAQTSKAQAEKALADRIAVEAATVAAAVQKARAEERAMRVNLEKDYEELKNARADDGRQLVDARQRLRQLATQRAAACGGGANVPGGAAAAGRTSAADAQLPERDQKLIDRLLQLGAQANEATRQRDLAVHQYEVNCRKGAE